MIVDAWFPLLATDAARPLPVIGILAEDAVYANLVPPGKPPLINARFVHCRGDPAVFLARRELTSDFTADGAAAMSGGAAAGTGILSADWFAVHQETHFGCIVVMVSPAETLATVQTLLRLLGRRPTRILAVARTVDEVQTMRARLAQDDPRHAGDAAVSFFVAHGDVPSPADARHHAEIVAHAQAATRQAYDAAMRPKRKPVVSPLLIARRKLKAGLAAETVGDDVAAARNYKAAVDSLALAVSAAAAAPGRSAASQSAGLSPAGSATDRR